MIPKPGTGEARRWEESATGEPFIGRYYQAVGPSWKDRLAHFWPFVAVPIFLTVFFLAVGEYQSWAEGLWAALFNTLASLCFGGSLFLVYQFVTADWIARTRSRAGRFALHMATVAGSVVVGAETTYLLFHNVPFFPPVDTTRGDLYRVGSVIMVVLWIIEFSYGRIRQRAHEVELSEVRARRDALRAQLQALQARTDPHFLFNSLNTVASLIEEDPRLAERAIERLSGLFRYALEGSRRSEVRLAEEMEAVRGYLEVEALRLGERLRYALSVEPGLDGLLIPPLVLQPVVENAVLHGVAPRVEGGRVEVAARIADGFLVLRVADDGPGPGGSGHVGSGTALETLRGRLDLAFGPAAMVEARRLEPRGFEVRIALPLTSLRSAAPASAEGAA
jgi:two-component system sensor histidine kinase AlgZ